ncbi:activator of Hsp90 ATPase [Abortiporus biennis]|nr:activator of Hsp90 ATPase [Abortiporus biennis]
MPTSTANWHWKNKNITPWAKSWFERELVTVSVKGEGEQEVSISKVVDVDGDVELGQRKSKLITIYDCKVELKWSGKASDGTEVEGTLSIPEVSHEVTLDGLSDYVYNWSLTTSSSPAVDALYKLAKSRLPTALEAKFAEFPVAIIEIHGKDLTVSTDTSRSGTPAPSGSTPKPATSSSAKSATSTPTPVKKAESKSVSSTTVTVDATFQASADDLFSILTDEKRIPSWTRAPAQSSAQADTEYSLFAGNVRGKYISLTPGKEIKQTWSLQSPTWPSGHFATLTTTLDQSTDNTKVTWSLVGVPLGLEEEISRNINGY